MNDIVLLKRKRKQIKPVRKTKLRHVVIYVCTLTVLFTTIYVTHNLTSRYDSGLMSQYGIVPVKSIHSTHYDPKELLSAMQPKKIVKKAPVRSKYVVSASMKQREDKYKPLIFKYFPEEPEIMLAIAKAESSLNSKAESYNCRYKLGGKTYDKLTQTYIDLETISKKRLPGYVSTFCRSGHEKFGWSKDSGLFGINSVHTTEELSIEEHVKLARKIYDSETKNAWVSYKHGLHKKYLVSK